MLINLTPLFKYRDYRLLYLGQFVSFVGSMLTYVALPYQIYQLTHSSLAVGNVGIIQLIPLLITSLWGGALADKYDRKKLLIVAEIFLAVACLILLVNSLFTHPSLWIVYIAAGLASAFNGFHRPTLEAITQVTVSDKKDMPAISSLRSFKSSCAMIIGPALGGLLLAKLNVSWVYFLDLLSYLISLIAIIQIKIRLNIKIDAESTLKSIKQGMHYAASRQELMGSYLVDFVAMIFGMPMALFPAIASIHSVTSLGWLYAAPSVGMLVATVISGWTHKVHRHGIAIAISAAIWGIAIIAFGLSPNLYMGLFFLAIAGAADGISGIFRNTLWNQTIPQNYRGRLAGIELISYMSGPLLGNAEAGLIAAAFGTQFSVVSGGLLCVIGVAILAILLPRFLQYSSLKDENNTPSQ